MTKQILLYIFLTILAVLCKKYLHTLIIYIDLAYAYINLKIDPLFQFLDLSHIWRNIMSMAFSPLLITGPPAVVYKLMKNKLMPHFFEITWLIWFIILISNILIR